ncbi:hypothetical protein ACRE_082220 [Hapsidospora chrysogenum ATCC 11550]|uniref:Uncharacterized protein n=1 Tax=Hapsidospora chrysogenum (strain ATCC 11550 / CBS 779.69 / DSM 880 / IAM 14645 / JCM 23072 / IMI 49137) TaxID=857340 RepID=A0A086SVE1_HAPC1|nr:hypothetical protein ACRE_082220 [Hapsidospora chrysogenum ATCC 11550]
MQQQQQQQQQQQGCNRGFWCSLALADRIKPTPPPPPQPPLAEVNLQRRRSCSHPATARVQLQRAAGGLRPRIRGRPAPSTTAIGTSNMTQSSQETFRQAQAAQQT